MAHGRSQRDMMVTCMYPPLNNSTHQHVTLLYVIPPKDRRTNVQWNNKMNTDVGCGLIKINVDGSCFTAPLSLPRPLAPLLPYSQPLKRREALMI